MSFIARRLTLPLVLAAATLAGVVLASGAGPAPAAAALEAGGDLDQIMGAMNKSMKKLGEQLADAGKNGESLALLHQMEESFQGAKLLTPKGTAAQQPGKRDDYVKAFRKQMNVAIMALIEIEQALLDNDNDKAKDAFGKLGAAKKEGHNKFKKD